MQTGLAPSDRLNEPDPAANDQHGDDPNISFVPNHDDLDAEMAAIVFDPTSHPHRRREWH